MMKRRYSTEGINEVSRYYPCCSFSSVKAMNMVGERLKGHDYTREMVKSKGSRIKSSRFYPKSVLYLTSVCLAFSHG